VGSRLAHPERCTVSAEGRRLFGYKRHSRSFLILDLGTSIHLGLDVEPHLLHPLDLEVNSVSTVSGRRDGESIGLLVFLTSDIEGRLASWGIPDLSRRSGNGRLSGVELVVVRGVGDLGLSDQLRYPKSCET
jgi:hypothetical protein